MRCASVPVEIEPVAKRGYLAVIIPEDCLTSTLELVSFMLSKVVLD